MPKRTDINSILIIGAGPIVIGQACEFDYSGTQACRILKNEGYRVILINSNPATIMTDPSTADRIYIEPITSEFLEKIIAKERPDALLPTVGGQTALNAAMDLHKLGILEKYGVQMIGASAEAIEKSENRKLFNEAMSRIGLDVTRHAIVHSLEEANGALKEIGLPAVIRPSFTLGGSGGGIAHTEEEFIEIVTNGLSMSPTGEVVIDESIVGWKEYEMEVIRDKKDNAIIICSIENVDPMGIHTGDSITVAPALTLTDKEYQLMRDASIAVLREIGVETGGSNVQFAVDPKTGRSVVIEMNPRVSRSSALASKATGYPIAKVAAKLAVGYTLDEIQNDITKVTPASFEPTIDYVVVKIPRFTFEKFPFSSPLLSTQMKSVGEAMSIGRSFAESLQKGFRSIEKGYAGLSEVEIDGVDPQKTLAENREAMASALSKFSHVRLLEIAQALRLGYSKSDIHEWSKFDPWYLDQIEEILTCETALKKEGLPQTKASFYSYKKMGFSDLRIAELIGEKEAVVRQKRLSFGIHPVFKKVDTCAAEFDCQTAYLYSTYEGNSVQDAECESNPSARKKVMILGGGPNRIGQGIEFDYACVHAAFSLKDEGIETIMVNCNPETVSTDYDTSDKLYFEPLTAEDVIEIALKEQSCGELLGVVVQFGGQTPLKLAKALQEAGIPIIGTTPDKLDLAEDRERFKALLETLKLRQPDNDICHRIEEIEPTINRLKYPVVIRPSNVLGGRAMAILLCKKDLELYLKHHQDFILDGPILVDKFLENATEIDVDALSDGTDVFVAGIMEHIEEAGIHSGDSACTLPTISLSSDQIKEINETTTKLAKSLNVVGLMNVQYAYQGNQLFIIEVNPRASRTVPFVAKATGNALANIAVKLMIGKKLTDFSLRTPFPEHYSVKEVVFPFARFENTDSLLGPEMKSTGEVMGIDKSFGLSFFRAQAGAGNPIPLSGNVLISVQDRDKPSILNAVKTLSDQGFHIFATKGTAAFLKANGIDTTTVNKEHEGGDHLVGQITKHHYQLIANTSYGEDVVESYTLRRSALMKRVPYVTTAAAFNAVVQAISELKDAPVSVTTVQEWLKV
ncbi:MAG: carbamoyl-phosphate synthase large subunit [Candidatus Margulisbacteria bacterium]|nr:carbamoyl-phosphate synthase large subunit [Candidatus Margulisiibacteriota bacterium]